MSGERVGLEYASELSLPNLLAGFLPDQPDKIALIEDTSQRSYAASIIRIYQLANGLIALGVQPGDRVAAIAWP